MATTIAAADCTDMAQVRTEIDALNSQILQLLAQRQQYVERAATLKTDTNEIAAPNRQAQIMANIRSEAEQLGMSTEVAEAVFASMIAAFIKHEQSKFNNLT